MTGEREIDLGLRIMDLMMHGATTMADFISQTLSYFEGVDPVARKLRGKDTLAVFVKPEELDLASKKLTQEGVANVKSMNTQLNGMGLIIFAQSDAGKAMDVINHFRAERARSGIVNIDVLRAEMDDNIRRIENVSLHEAMLFAGHAGENDIHIAMERPRQGEYSVVFGADDMAKIQQIRRSVALELSGIPGEALRKQLDYENENAMYIRDQILNKDADINVYDLEGKSIVSDDRKIVFIDVDGDRMTIYRNERNFHDRTSNLLASLRNPVYLDNKDYLEIKSISDREEKKKRLSECDRKNGRPVYTREEVLAIQKLEASKALYEKELATHSNDQMELSFSFTNDEMRMMPFVEKGDVEISLDKDILKEALDRSDELKITDPADLENYDYGDSLYINAIENDKEFYGERFDAYNARNDENANFLPDQYEREE